MDSAIKMAIPIYVAFLPNFSDSFWPNINPKKVKKQLIIEKIMAASIIVALVIPMAIPTEKLSMLTVKEKRLIDAMFVITPFFSSFLDINISSARRKKIKETIISALGSNFSKNTPPIIDPR